MNAFLGLSLITAAGAHACFVASRRMHGPPPTSNIMFAVHTCLVRSGRVWSGLQEMAMLLERGSLCRTTGSTLMNAHSSRSHAIFTVLLEQRIGPEGEASSGDEKVHRIAKRERQITYLGTRYCVFSGARPVALPPLPPAHRNSVWRASVGWLVLRLFALYVVPCPSFLNG